MILDYYSLKTRDACPIQVDQLTSEPVERVYRPFPILSFTSDSRPSQRLQFQFCWQLQQDFKACRRENSKRVSFWDNAK